MSSTFKTARIHVQSGTGNTNRLSLWLAESLAGEGIEVQRFPVDAGVPRQAHQVGPDRLVVLMGPAHGFTTPWSLLQLARRLPRGRGTRAAVVLSRGSFMLGPLQVPGMEGTGAWLLAILLWLRGYCVRAVRAIDMPVNWTAAHPALSERASREVIRRARPRVDVVADALLQGRCHYRGFFFLLIGLVLLPISVLYLLIGRFFLAKLFFADGRCTGCGMCARNCPENAIEMFGPGKGRPYWTFRCESCMRCMGYCPTNAIQAGHSWGVLLYLAVMLPIVWSVLDLLVPDQAALFRQAPFLVALIWYLDALLSLMLAYAVFFWLTRIPPIGALFSWTTLTRAYSRYHEPDTKVCDLTEMSPVPAEDETSE